MSATEDRKALIDGAAVLHAELQKFTTRMHAVINKMIGEADQLMIAHADEVSNGEVVKTTKVKFSKGAAEPSAEGAPSLAPGKRACSICRKPGHRKQNCPEAHIKYAQDRAKDGDFETAKEASAMARGLSLKQSKKKRGKK